MMTPENQNTLDQLLNTVKERSKTFIGYPTAVDFDYTELYPLLQYSLNNVGDPFVDTHTDMHTKNLEREVVEFYSKLFNAPQNDWWGYVTNGGSEGNLYALYVARELYPTAMVYYTEATHYSVQKNIHLLNMNGIVIRSQENGEMDYDDLHDTIQFHRQQPAIILANIGTTMTEAKDDIQKIRSILKKFAIRSHYIHADAALAGPMLASIGKSETFDFSAGTDSIAISGHKFIGSPIPCGLVLVKRSNRDRVSSAVSYIGSMDNTITGSRNAITPLFMWYAIKKLGLEGLKERAHHSLELAEYVTVQMNARGIPAWRNKDAITVVFPRPSDHLCRKWQLASDGHQSHLICMPGVSREQLDLFLNELTLELETRNSKLETRNENLGIENRNSKPETRNDYLEIGNGKLEMGKELLQINTEKLTLHLGGLKEFSKTNELEYITG